MSSRVRSPRSLTRRDANRGPSEPAEAAQPGETTSGHPPPPPEERFRLEGKTAALSRGDA